MAINFPEYNFVLHPRIKVSLTPGGVTPALFEVSFNPEEIKEARENLKKMPRPNMVWPFINQNTEELTEELLDNIKAANICLAPTGRCFNALEIYERLKRVYQLHRLFDLPNSEHQTIGEHSQEVAVCANSIFFYNYGQLGEHQQNLLDLWQPWLVLAGLFHGITKGLKQKPILLDDWLGEILAKCYITHFYSRLVLILIASMSILQDYMKGCSDAHAVKQFYQNNLEELRQYAHPQQQKMLDVGVLFQGTIALWLADSSNYSSISCLLNGRPIYPSFDANFIYLFSNHAGRYQLVTVKPQEQWQKMLDSLHSKLVLDKHKRRKLYKEGLPF